MPVRIRFGAGGDVEAAVDVFERSNLVRREGIWPDALRAERIARVRAHLRGSDSWFLVAVDGEDLVGMASAEPLRGDSSGCFLGYLYVVPERWGEGIGGDLLDRALAEARRRGHSRVHLWTYEDNDRSHHLYRSRGFAPTGRVADGEGEWAREL